MLTGTRKTAYMSEGRIIWGNRSVMIRDLQDLHLRPLLERKDELIEAYYQVTSDLNPDRTFTKVPPRDDDLDNH